MKMTRRSALDLMACSALLCGCGCSLFKGAKKSGLVPCVGCARCQPCPHGVDIPGVFKFVNDCFANGELGADGKGGGLTAEQRRKIVERYDAQFGLKSGAGRCRGCRRCLSKCPRHINIPQELAKIDTMIAELLVVG